MSKPDNIDNEIHDSVDSYVFEEESTDKQRFFSISGNLKYEYNFILKLKSALSNLDAISVSDIETLLGYANDINDLIVILLDYQHTLGALSEFEKIFKLKDVNGGVFVIKVLKKHRNRRRRIKRKYRKLLKV